MPTRGWAQGSQTPTSLGDAPALTICRGGGVQVWGGNDYGELGLGTVGASVATPQTNPYLHNVAALAWSTDHSVALLHDGSIWTFGRNDFGQLGIGNQTNQSVPRQVPDLNCAKAIAVGDAFTLALLDDGSVWGWGDNSQGQLGIPNTSTTFYTTPRQIINGNVKAISAGLQYAIALTNNNALYSWGHDFDGELGINAPGSVQFSPMLITMPAGSGSIKEISAGYERAVALSTTGQVYTWGQNDGGQLGIGAALPNGVHTPVALSLPQPVVHIASATRSTLAMLSNGSTYFWGNNYAGESGTNCNTTLQFNSPIAGPTFPAGTVVEGAASFGFYAILPNGNVRTWGSNTSSLLGYPTSPNSFSCTPTSPVGVCSAVPSQEPQSGCCGITHNYFQNQGATYVATNYYSGSAPYEIGEYNTLTTIDANGGTIVFDGVYHVKGPVAFENGKVELRPGTVFYVEPRTKWQASGAPSCYPHLGYDEFNSRLYVGKKARLYLAGATLRPVCDDMWAGVQLAADGQLYTSGNSVIRDAYIGVMAGEYCKAVDAHYFLKETTFLNCRFGLVDLEKSKVASGEGIVSCTFTSDPATMVAPFANQYTQTGLVLDGTNLLNLQLTGNVFDRLVRGVQAGGYRTRIAGNTFTRCYDAAVSVVGDFLYKNYSRRVTVTGNTITVPNDYFTSTQIAQDNPVTGVRAFGLTNLYTSTLSYFFIEGNTISGANPNPVATSKPQIGVEMYAFGGGATRQQNVIRYLDEGVRLQDAGRRLNNDDTTNIYPMTPELLVADNRLDQNGYGIELRGDLYNHTIPLVECNTLDNTGLSGSYGVHIDPNATVSDLGSSSYPVGNKYLGFGALTKVVNDQSAAITYWQYSSEGVTNISGLGGGIILPATSATPLCGSNYRGNYTNGLQRSAVVSAATVAGWMQQLRGKQGTRRQLLEVEDLLIDYHHQRQQQAALLAFVGTLPGYNDSAYYRLSFYLLDFYRRNRQAGPAAQLRTALRRVGAADVHVLARLDLSQVLDSLALGRHARLSPADSTTLRRVAATATGSASLADAVLRHFYPQLPGRVSRYPQLSPRSATRTLSALAASAVQLYPNPATHSVRVSYQPTTAKAEVAQLVVRDLRTGQAMHTATLPAGQTDAEVDVRKLPAGLYACQLLVAGRLVDVQRLYVVH